MNSCDKWVQEVDCPIKHSCFITGWKEYGAEEDLLLMNSTVFVICPESTSSK